MSAVTPASGKWEPDVDKSSAGFDISKDFLPQTGANLIQKSITIFGFKSQGISRAGRLSIQRGEYPLSMRQ